MMRAVLFILFFLPVWLVQAQSFNYHSYTVEDGLPSSQTYDILQDRKKFIWIASDGGVARYDGYTFTHFTVADGLLSNTIYRLYEDRFGRMWFLSNLGKICYYDGRKIVPYKYNATMLSVLRRSYDVFACFRVEKDSSILFSTLYSGIYRIHTNGKMQALWETNQEFVDYCKLVENGAESYGYGVVNGRYIQRSLISLHYQDKRTDFATNNIVHSKNIFCLVRKNGHVVFSTHGELFDCYRGHVVQNSTYPNVAISLYEDSDSCLWVGFYNGGVKRYPPNRSFDSPDEQTFFPRKQITKVMEDHEHGVWFTTLHDGVLYAPNIHIQNLYMSEAQQNDEKAVAIGHDHRSRVFIGTNQSNLYTYSGGAFVNKLHATGRNPNGLIKLLFYDTVQTQLYIGTYMDMFVLDKTGKKANLLVKSGVVAMGYDGEGEFYAGTYQNLITHYPCNTMPDVLYPKEHMRSDALCLDEQKTLWVGSPAGLFYYKKGEKIARYGADTTLRGVTCLARSGRYLFAGTTGGKLLRINTRKPDEKPVYKPICDGNIYNLEMNGPYLWVSSSRGVARFNLKTMLTEQLITKAKGLLSTEVKQVKVLNDTVYALTHEGVSYFRSGDLRKNNVPPVVHILSCQVDTVNYIRQKDPEFNYRKNYITFSFVGLNYRSLGKVKYRYRLKGYNSEWKYTDLSSVQFAFLPAGDYTFEVVAINEDGVESTVPAKFSFTILLPFWKTPWFIMACVLFVMGIVFLVFLIRYRRLKEKNALLEQITDLRQRSMAMQMNPHFIFNSLNSIQAFILNEDSGKATKYLTRFAKLIRMALYHSGAETVSLDEEMALLKLYMELEQVRLKGKFDFEVLAEPSLKANEVQIPPMLLQPLVENSIKHGITGDKKGSIQVRFYRQAGKLMCRVEDNGKGIIASKKEKEHLTQEHKSMGMELTRQRVKLFCEKEDHEFVFITMDKSEMDVESTGTVTVFTLPGK